MNFKNAIYTLATLGILTGCNTTPAGPSSTEPRQVNIELLERKPVMLFVEEDTGLPYTGQAVERYRGGELHRSMNFVKGVPTGTATEYFESGQKKNEVEIINGKLEGTETEWYETGQMKSMLTYENGRPQQKRTWSENGAETTVPRELAEALNLSRGAKVAVAEFYQDTGEFPADNAVAGMSPPDKISSQFVAAITIENGVISISLQNSAGNGLGGRTLLLTPTATYGSVSWECSSPDIASAMLANACK